MASGFRRKRGDDEYVFIDGHALRADEVVRIDLRDTSDVAVPGQGQASAVPGEEQAAGSRRSGRKSRKGAGVEGGMGQGLRSLESEDAFALTDEAQEGEVTFERTTLLLQEERRSMRVKYMAFGAVLLLVAAFTLCMSYSQPGIYHTPAECIASVGAWFQLQYAALFHPDLYQSMYRDVNASMPYYADCTLQVWTVLKYVVCGAFLALSGMLYQNTFRNPIAAPSMLGVSNGINFALLILVLLYGQAALQHTGEYYVYSFVGGIAVLLLVMLGGKWISGKGRFNVVNMILMGTIVSQLLGVLLTYAQAMLMDDAAWEVYYQLQSGVNVRSVWSFATLVVGGLVALVPVFLFRFRLNLLSFSDGESRLLGVNPNKLRLLALVCGSIMILVAQVNLGQVAMASLIVPFIARAVFGSEFRKQLGGNIMLGALILLACGDVGMLVKFDGVSVGVGTVVSIVAMPLFVWMIAIRQRSWE